MRFPFLKAKRFRSQSTGGYVVGIVNGLSTHPDSLNRKPAGIAIAATNFAEKVAQAVTRAARFDWHLTVGPLDCSEGRSMFSAELLADVATDAVLDRLGDQSTCSARCGMRRCQM